MKRFIFLFVFTFLCSFTIQKPCYGGMQRDKKNISSTEEGNAQEILSSEVTQEIEEALVLYGFQPITGDLNDVMGYKWQSQQDCAMYCFPDDSKTGWNETTRLEIVAKYENILKTLRNQYNVKFSNPEFYFTPSADYNMGYRESSGRRIIINPFDKKSIGAVSSYTGNPNNPKFPAWLCVGLELYLDPNSRPNTCVEYDLDQLLMSAGDDAPLFGDTWLVPGFFQPEVLAAGQEIAYRFVVSLIDSGIFADFFGAYLNGADMSDLLMNSWDSFCDGAFDLDITSMFTFYNDYVLKFETNQIAYTFRDKDIVWDKIKDPLDYVERAATFTKEWLEVEYKEKINITARDRMKNGYAGLTSVSSSPSINALMLCEDTASVYLHEIVHVLLKVSKYITYSFSLDIFNEGIATFLTYEFESNELNNKYKSQTQAYLELFESQYVDNGVEPNFLEYYKNRTGKPWVLGGELNDLNISVCYDFSSILAFKRLKSFYDISENDIKMGFDTGICSYGQACSFVNYLYTTYGKEKLLQASSNCYEIESIYNKTIFDLVEDWKKYILLHKYE